MDWHGVLLFLLISSEVSISGNGIAGRITAIESFRFLNLPILGVVISWKPFNFSGPDILCTVITLAFVP